MSSKYIFVVSESHKYVISVSEKYSYIYLHSHILGFLAEIGTKKHTTEEERDT